MVEEPCYVDMKLLDSEKKYDERDNKIFSLFIKEFATGKDCNDDYFAEKCVGHGTLTRWLGIHHSTLHGSHDWWGDFLCNYDIDDSAVCFESLGKSEITITVFLSNVTPKYEIRFGISFVEVTDRSSNVTILYKFIL